MVCFKTKNPNLGKFWRALEWKMLVYVMAIWYILLPFGNGVEIWCIFPRFGILCQEKSGNTVANHKAIQIWLHRNRTRHKNAR
jgi:hypothetical protein